MARRSIFNDPPLNSSDGEVPEHQPSDLSVIDPGSDPETLSLSDGGSQSNSDELPLSDGDLQSNSEEHEEHDELSSASSSSSEGSDEQPYRWGSCEDTEATIRPYCGVLASLDRDHSTSLSNHLYSAHLIKKRNYIAPDSYSDSYPESDSEPSTRTKKQRRREYSPSTLAGGTLLSRPRRFITNSWTSWPHPPSHVPRESEHKTGKSKSQPNKLYFDGDNYDRSLRMKGVEAPSQMLEEMLTATFLRVSKEKLRSRPEKEVGGVVPMLDDDISAHMLKPIVRNVISKLDGLLVGLYHERRYVKALAEEDQEVEVMEPGGLNGRKKMSQYKQTQARKKVQPTARKRRVTTIDTEEDYESIEDEGEGSLPMKNTLHAKSSRVRRRNPAPPKRAKEYAVKRKNRLRLRDWSQVLGIASLTGWDDDTLQKTVKRCERQFKQTMCWRRLKQDDHIKEQRSGEVWTGARLKKPMGSDNNEGENGTTRDGFMVPIRGVGRKKKAILKPSLKERRRMKVMAKKEGGNSPDDDYVDDRDTRNNDDDVDDNQESDASVDTK